MPLCLQAVRTGLNAKASGDTGRVMVVLLTDGRANVSLAKSNEDPEALAEGAPKLSKVGSPARGLQVVQRSWLIALSGNVLASRSLLCVRTSPLLVCSPHKCHPEGVVPVHEVHMQQQEGGKFCHVMLCRMSCKKR